MDEFKALIKEKRKHKKELYLIKSKNKLE